MIKSIEFPAFAASTKTERHIHKEFKEFHLEKELFDISCLEDAIRYTKQLSADLYAHIQKNIIGSEGGDTETGNQNEKEVIFTDAKGS